MSNFDQPPLLNGRPIPRLQEPIDLGRDATMSNTPDVAANIEDRLMLGDTTTEDEEDFDTEDDDSSLDEDDIPAVLRGLTISELPTGLCYDERMRYHSEVSATTGENVHPEDPRRIYYIFKELVEAGLVANGTDKSNVFVRQPLLRIDAREATEEECCLVHTRHHYDFVRSTSAMRDEELIDLSEAGHMDSIYFNALSYFAGKLSAGGAIETCRAVVNRTVKNAIAVIRPPGHHAEVDITMGFCLFNNVCIASRVCQNDFGEQCRKILIIDWDVHHGNGCQKAFYEDPNILYISLHVHMDGRFYPAGPDGGLDRVGAGAGVGKNVNIPWPTKGMGDGDYMYAFQHVVMPIASEFDPDLVIVAAGFDAAAGDELGGCFVTPPCYAHMTHMLMSLATGKVAVCLEGGYNFGAISKSAVAVTRTLMGEPPDRLEPTQATQSAVETVEMVRKIHSRYWRNLYPKDPVGLPTGGERLHDILRMYQAHQLSEAHHMITLPIERENLSPSFKNQILATRNYEHQANLLVIFHDPPEIRVPAGRTSTLVEAHDTSYHDSVAAYISRAISLGFGVVDVNIPKEITVPMRDEDAGPHGPTVLSSVQYDSNLTDVARKEASVLANYLWANYIEPMVEPSTNIILMGCGHAFHAVARLISESENLYQSLAGVIGFIATNPVRPVSNQASPWVSSWYRENSRIYVSETHGLWRTENKSGKVSRKYGSLKKSAEGTVMAIMQREQEDAWTWIATKASAVETESTEDEMEVKEEVKDEMKGEVDRDPRPPTAVVKQDVAMMMER